MSFALISISLLVIYFFGAAIGYAFYIMSIGQYRRDPSMMDWAPCVALAWPIIVTFFCLTAIKSFVLKRT